MHNISSKKKEKQLSSDFDGHSTPSPFFQTQHHITKRITTPSPPMLPNSQATRPSPGAAQHESTTHNYHHNPI